jgi:ubiquitin-protein ligase
MSATPEDPVPVWKYKQGDLWMSCDESLSFVLECEYTAGNTRCTPNDDEIHIVYNFKTMTCDNKKTKEQIPIQRILMLPANKEEEEELRRSIPQFSLLSQASIETIRFYLKHSGNDVMNAALLYSEKSAAMTSISEHWAKQEGLTDWAQQSAAASLSSSLKETADSESRRIFTEEHISQVASTLNRTKRLSLELSMVQRSSVLSGTEVHLIEERIDVWGIRIRKEQFDSASELYRDILRLPTDWPGNIDHIRLEAIFPPAYPLDPPFIRVVYPIFVPATGNISVGGSICLETLVNTGTTNGYTSKLTMEAILQIIVFNMMTGNEEHMGPGRIDFTSPLVPVAHNSHSFQPRLCYSFEDGIQHFQRISTSVHDWGNRVISRDGVSSFNSFCQTIMKMHQK